MHIQKQPEPHLADEYDVDLYILTSLLLELEQLKLKIDRKQDKSAVSMVQIKAETIYF